MNLSNLPPCPKCSSRWAVYGAGDRVECKAEHVFLNLPDQLEPIDYPQWDEQAIRDAEVELYMEKKINELPNRRRAIELLRYEHDASSDGINWRRKRYDELT